MSEGTVTFAITADTTDAFASIAELQVAIDQQARDMRIHRNTLIRQLREGFTLISSLMSSFRQAMSLIGAQIDPFFSALVGLVLSTTSMLLSAGTTLALTGIGGVAGAIILGLAISFNILTLAKLADDKFDISRAFTTMRQEMLAHARGAIPRQVFGGAFTVG